MNRKFRKVAMLSAMALLSSQASAALLLGSGASGNTTLVQIDTVAQTVTTVGDPGEYGPEIQLTPDASTVLMTDTSGNLWSIDPSDGSNLGSTTIIFPDTPDDNENTATALEFVGGTLYAAFDRAGPETNPGYLGTINPATGATTGIGTLTGMNAPAGGLAYSGGTMYAVSSANSEFSQLYTVNLATGAATLVSDITFGGNQVEAMTALAIVDGVAYTKSNDTTGGVDENVLYSLDLNTGELTEVFDMGQYVVALTTATATTGGTGEASAIPTLPQWAMIIMALVLATFGASRLRQHKA